MGEDVEGVGEWLWDEVDGAANVEVDDVNEHEDDKKAGGGEEATDEAVGMGAFKPEVDEEIGLVFIIFVVAIVLCTLVLGGFILGSVAESALEGMAIIPCMVVDGMRSEEDESAESETVV